MEIKFGGSLNWEDFKTAQSFSGKKNKIVLLFFGLWFAVPSGLCLGGVLLGRIADPMGGICLATLFGSFSFMCFYSGLFSERVAWKKVKQSVECPQSGSITENGIKVTTESFSGEFSWNAFNKHKRTEALVVLFTGSVSGRVIPRHFFESDADWASLVDLVKSKVPAG